MDNVIRDGTPFEWAGPWHELIREFGRQRRRQAKVDDIFRVTRPRPGATAEQLLTAERRLSRRIPDQYREFLTVANGWRDWCDFDSLHSARQLGPGNLASEGPIIFDQPDLTARHRDLLCFQSTQDSYHEAYLVCRARDGLRAGQVVTVGSDEVAYDSLETYFGARLSDLTAFTDGLVARHERTSARASIRTVVSWLRDELGDGSRSYGDPIPLPNPPAHRSAIDAVEKALGRPLDSAHRELLLAMDGWSIRGNLPHILSTSELITGEPWLTIATAAIGSEPRIDDGAVGRMNGATVTPFAVRSVFAASRITHALGIDVADGCVRDIVGDRKYSGGTGGYLSPGTVDGFLRGVLQELTEPYFQFHCR